VAVSPAAAAVARTFDFEGASFGYGFACKQPERLIN
jgi:hypothetical protein